MSDDHLNLLLVRPLDAAPAPGRPAGQEVYVLVDVSAAADAPPLARCVLSPDGPGRVRVEELTVAESSAGFSLRSRLLTGVADRMRAAGMWQLRGVAEDGTPFDIWL